MAAATIKASQSAFATMANRGTHFIDGKFVAPARGGTFPVLNPANNRVVGRAAAGTAEDVEAAVAAAARAFGSSWWCRADTAARRARVLRKIAEAVKARKAALSYAETVDCGKPYPESEWDMDDVAGCFEWAADLADAQLAKQATANASGTAPVPLPDDEYSGELLQEPVGVVAAIVPWNYPLLMAAWKVAPALAAGCSVVLKPSELTPVTALELARLCTASGLPDGLFNVARHFLFAKRSYGE